jgi:uncharacterized Zn-finger protein
VDIKKIVNFKGPKGAAAATATAVAVVANGTAQDLHLLYSISQANTIAMSDTGSKRGNSPQDSEHTRYSDPRFGQLNGMNDGPNVMYYPSPQQGNDRSGRQSAEGKAFPCSTCGKGFARRSDLTRHGKVFFQPAPFFQFPDLQLERIHSGIRPHVCEHSGCGKQFIQRSALTGHMRVHTGEKPYMCERCGKVNLDPL